MFDPDQFIADCRSALGEDESHKSGSQVFERAVSDPAQVLAGLGAPKRAGVQNLFSSDDLTVISTGPCLGSFSPAAS